MEKRGEKGVDKTKYGKKRRIHKGGIKAGKKDEKGEKKGG